MRPSQAFCALEELRKHSSVSLCRKGIILSDDDSQTVLDVYQQWLALALDLGYLHPEDLSRSARRLWTDMVQVDVYDLLSSFAECLQLVRLQTSKGFKGLCAHISSHLYSIVNDDMEHVCEGDVYAAKRLMQLFSFMSRLSLQDIDLTQQLLESYMETEEAIPQVFPEALVQSLNKILKNWIGPFRPDTIRPQHGPGGVAGHGRCSLEVKYNDLTTDQLLEYAFGEPTWAREGIRSAMDRMSQTIFVPKSYKTFRTISMEPCTLQYFQQGVWKAIVGLVGRNSYLRAHIGFDDQSRNQYLAREGSMNRNYATIDLSSASDSVSYELVKRLFKGTWLLRFLVATRSRRTLLPDGRIVELRKFAPMGSALCFPVETLIFAALCEHVTREHRFFGRYSVYGDDIIVPTQCVEIVMRALQNLGFHVNHDKSFYTETCWFRESCGGEYCDGFDVTPMKISRKYASREHDVRLTKLIALANTAFDRGFFNLRYFFLRKLRDSGFVALFGPSALHAWNYTNFHTEKRWNRNLQRIDVKVTNLKTKYDAKLVNNQDENIRYRHWLESTQDRQYLGMGFQSVICKPTVSLFCAWMGKPYEDTDQVFIDTHRVRENTLSIKQEGGKV